MPSRFCRRPSRCYGARIGGLPAADSRCFSRGHSPSREQFSEAIARGQEAVEIAEAVANPVSVVHAHFGVGIALLRRGEQPVALPDTRRATLLRVGGLGPRRRLHRRRSSRRGLPLLEQALDHATRTETLIYHPLRLAWLAVASLAKDRTSEALAVDLASAQKEAGDEAWAQRVLGEATSRSDSPEREKAEDHYRESMALAADRGMRPLVSHCHLGLVTLYRHTGRPAESREHLTTAAMMYREMGMLFWLEQAAAELTDLG